MPIFQAYNKRSKAWVKYKKLGDDLKILDMKQRNPLKPFKNVKIRGKTRKSK